MPIKRNDKNESVGSIWTSFSDLFTTVAILFLILFFIILIKQSVMSVASQKKEQDIDNFMKGQISDKDLNKVKKEKEKMRDKLLEISKYESQATQNIMNLEKMVEKIASYQEDADKILKDNLDKIATISHLKNLHNDVKKSLEKSLHINKELKLKLQKSEEELAVTKNTIKEQTAINKTQKQNFEKTKTATNASYQKEINNLKTAYKDETHQLKNSSDKDLSEKTEKINSLHQSNKSLTAKLESTTTESRKKEDIFSKELGQLKAGLNRANNQLKGESKIRGNLENSLEKAIGNSKKSSSQIAECKRKFQTSSKELQECNTYAEPTKIRNNMAKNLNKRFQKAGIQVTTDINTGTITIEDGDIYLFPNDSSLLSERVKNQIQKIAPIISDEIFNNSEVKKMIHEISIVGHASPRYNGAAVNPNDLSKKDAYKSNLYLSTERAMAVSNYLFSLDDNLFPNKALFRSLTKSSGLGYSRPLHWDSKEEKEKDPEVNLCGNYSCKKSRRVEIQFNFKHFKSPDK